ncbi:hypothetical protein G7B40_030950 [Aetokthonos hydrillicola Thurmond2011]|jgi:hypothetical protein|uniref:Uncharacterized protein n=1 Tax=Aetokthonos hydrillicola Thurmond2011 TaxID=2712845 RepID=A0AAP5ICE2_9CYAN|nr:hypothetical protein [Aetokthonos hydrillicola]MBW4589689.1 hypothetical protein [Aetokthonos hydrillicola CCALA 1050]MDR9898943.1 hypothetical protein [Aetokthonos hydrillicola Thurmond2011]
MFNKIETEEIASLEEKIQNTLADNLTASSHYLDDHLNGTDKERLIYLKAALVTQAVKNGAIQDVATAITVLQSGTEQSSYEVNCHPNKHLKKLRALLALRVQHGLPIDDVVKAMDAIARSRKGLIEEFQWNIFGDPSKLLTTKSSKPFSVKVENSSRSAISFYTSLFLIACFGLFGFFCFKSGYQIGETPAEYRTFEKMLPN